MKPMSSAGAVPFRFCLSAWPTRTSSVLSTRAATASASMALACALVVGLVGCASPSTARDLEASVDRLLGAAPLSKASVGIYVARLGDGRTVLSRGGDRPMTPASNQKILTALAALGRFGPTHRFETRVWSSGPPDTAGHVARLRLEGGGDPALTSEQWWRLAADLRRLGLRAVDGPIRVDDRRFDPPGWHPSWGRVSSRAYHAPIGALTANYGTFTLAARPHDTIGSGLDLWVDPPVDYFRLTGRGKTVGAKGARALRVHRRALEENGDGLAHEVVQVDGQMRVGDEVDVVHRSVVDPGLYAASVLALQLDGLGVPVAGEATRSGSIAETPHLLHVHEGRALAEIVSLCMKWSSNPIAESLLKNLGAFEGSNAPLGAPARQGDWAGGARALRAELEGMGLALDEAVLVDGSGLSTSNRLRPRTLVEALRIGARRFDFGVEFRAAFPIAGRDGTLADRLKAANGRVRAKTGLLADAGVAGLSGFVERPDGDVWIFSILVNGHRGGAGDAMRAIDRIVLALAEAPVSKSTGASGAGGPAPAARGGGG